MLLFFDKIIVSLFCLLPFTLVTGPFIPDLTVVLIGVYGLITIYKNKSYDILYSNYFIFFYLFYLVLIISSLTSNNPFFSFESSIFYFRYFFFIIGIIYLFNNYFKY